MTRTGLTHRGFPPSSDAALGSAAPLAATTFAQDGDGRVASPAIRHATGERVRGLPVKLEELLA